ncbi:MAG: glycosyl hydrolase [Pseudomonadota bacterium]|nr:glycosyl hydrolase [Pseudomonadota bacterium]
MWFFISGALIFIYSRRELLAVWREPVLRRPVLVIESDDWGAGPPDQSGVLDEIFLLLAGCSDCDGRPPLMTLGIILATADGSKFRSNGSYQRKSISEAAYRPLLDVINKGVEAGVFSVQLHGLEHFWPSALMTASEGNKAVKAWLNEAPLAVSEDLPSPLQSRWVDASVLPARPLPRKDVKRAVREEVDAFQSVFAVMPEVAVPPTFVWNRDVEQAWAAAGVGVIVTPGRRFETRDDKGRPADAGAPIYNGQLGEKGIIYLVRDVYFEPSLGHSAEQALTALASKVRLCRPALFETHRFNFLGTEEKRNRALAELERLLRMAVRSYPDLAFLSSGKLATILKNRDPEWVEPQFRRRLHVWITRLGEFTRLRKLAWLTGWIVPAGLLWRLTG